MGTGGLSTRRLDRMRAILAGYVERNAVPGLVALVARHGQVHLDVLGAQAIGGAPMRRDTIVRIASMTKPITAVATMILVEECQLRLDDPEMFFRENSSWGFGMAVYTRRNDGTSTPGRFGWDGGLGTSAYADPSEDVIGILLTQVAWNSPSGPQIWNDFWTSVYAAIDD